MYAVKFTPYGLADVKALPKNVKNGLRKQLAGTLARDPVGCSEELQGAAGGVSELSLAAVSGCVSCISGTSGRGDCRCWQTLEVGA